MRRLLLGFLAAAVLAAEGACGVPLDDEPRALSSGEAPLELLGADPLTTTTTGLPGASSEVTIYLSGPRTDDPGRPERLVAVERRVPAPASVEKVVQMLLTGPRHDEARQGLRSAINPETTILSAVVERGIATIDLSGNFAVGSGTDQIVALAQIVFTATDLGGVVGVRFTLDGRSAEVPSGDGTLTRTPLGRAAFATFGPR